MGKEATSVSASKYAPNAKVRPREKDGEVPVVHDHQLTDAILQIFCPSRAKQRESKYHAKQNATTLLYNIFNLLRRLTILGCAIVYIVISINAIMSTMTILQEDARKVIKFAPSETQLMVEYAGTTTIRESTMIKDILGDVTTPQTGTLYLDSATSTSMTECSNPEFNSTQYGDTFLRSVFTNIKTYATYNLTFLAQMELIMPVVDCSLDALGDHTLLRTFYLVRSTTDTEDVYLMGLTVSNQDYSIPTQNQKGPAAVATMFFVNDMRAESVSHNFLVSLGYPFGAMQFRVYYFSRVNSDFFWVLESVPAYPAYESSKELLTASRSGFYISGETEQSNIKNEYWTLGDTPREAIGYWRWQGGIVIHDSWAWVHYLHIWFVIDGLFNLAVLFLIIYRNLSAGKVWVGDAFASVSNSLLFRGCLILITWYINEFWMLMEYCISNANQLTGTQRFFSYTELIHADMLTIYLSSASIIGYLLRTRIDPALAVILFEIGFSCRVSIAKAFPSWISVMKDYTVADYALSILSMSDTLAASTPMRFWTIHELTNNDLHFIIVSWLPVYITIVFIVIYGILRKIYRIYRPEEIHVQKATSYSDNKEALVAQKGTLTYFEVATGAALQKKLGLVSDYENCLFIKGIKYASADGIYCAGYVIANGKFLIATEDLISILIMKIICIRFKNVYVYEVSGSTVQQTARLVYPQTISWNDLLHININVLS